MQSKKSEMLSQVVISDTAVYCWHQVLNLSPVTTCDKTGPKREKMQPKEMCRPVVRAKAALKA